MSSTYSTNLALELIGTGDQAGTWGSTTNTNLGTLVEQAITGYVTQAVTTGVDTTITIPNGATGVARNMYIELTGTGGASTNLIVPNNKKLYFIYNNSTGAVTVKVVGQTGVSVPNGKKMSLVCNGTDVVPAVDYFESFSVGSFTITDLSLTSATITTLTSTSANITTLNSTSANLTTLSGTSANLTTLSGTSANITALTGTSLSISSNASLAASSGNVGIGTASPGYKLDVSGGSLRLPNAEWVFFNNFSGTARAVLGYSSGNDVILDSVDGTVILRTGTTERVRIESAGNVDFKKGAATTPYAIGNSSTAFTVNFNNSNVQTVTMTGNVASGGWTLSNPQDGQTLNLFITQDGTGGRTLGWPTSFKWSGGAAGTITSTANAVDLLVITYRSATGFYYATLLNDMK